ncbi:hypothetical protein [Pseudomonas aeruginosa]|uniref:hypothetical protein n=1 Tax=Pseudomonas aeruginosa TaxID=287 RepID=UPI0007A05E81|nr:hypothetical protein [Pseudomonas aeruginosa]KYO84482.1 hypothetical protein LT18_00142 [Pseudomonas aeruginosa]
MTDINRVTATRNLDAYYYGFDPTGCDLVDSVLEQVARAGKAFHSTDDWNEEDLDGLSPVDKMQAAANASAKTIMALIAEVERLRIGLKGDFDLDAWLEWTREKDQIKAEIEALRRFAAEAYQVLGALDAPENVLDNASDAANGVPLRHETLLPFFADDYESIRKDAERYRFYRQGFVSPRELDTNIDAALEGATQ